MSLKEEIDVVPGPSKITKVVKKYPKAAEKSTNKQIRLRKDDIKDEPIPAILPTLLQFASVEEFLSYKQQQSVKTDQDEFTSYVDFPTWNKCYKCKVNIKSHIFIPCGHLAVCASCANSFQKEFLDACVVCNQEYVQIVRVRLT